MNFKHFYSVDDRTYFLARQQYKGILFLCVCVFLVSLKDFVLLTATCQPKTVREEDIVPFSYFHGDNGYSNAP
jgi:hypothetical protein